MVRCDGCGVMYQSEKGVILFFIPYSIEYCKSCAEDHFELLELYEEEFMYEED